MANYNGTRDENENRTNADEKGTTTCPPSVRIDMPSPPNHRQTARNNESTPLLEKRAPPSDSDDDDDDASSTISAGSGSTTHTIRALPGMKVRSHGINTDGTLRDCPSREALKFAKSRAGHYWIDIDADERDSDELHAWLTGGGGDGSEGQLDLPNFFLSILVEPSGTWASQVVSMKKKSLAVVRFLPEREESDEMAHLAALSLPNLLLTFTSCPKSETGDLYAAVHRYMHDRERLPDPTSSGALLAWLRFHVERTSRSTRELRTYVLSMDAAMDRNVSSISLDEIIDVKDQLLRLLSVAEEQNECLEALAGAEADTDALDFANLRGALSVLLATAAATERNALRLEKHVADLRQRYEGHQQERINRRLAVLTVLSAVFLPLTLVTGIWGMNFEYMPELTHYYAYPLALFAMFTVAVTMICYFWRTGWFD